MKRNSFLLPLSFPQIISKKRADNPIIWPREESCSGRYSLDLTKKRKRKKGGGGKKLKFLFRFPEKRTVYEKGGQGWMGQIKFCSPWKIGFLSVFPAQPAATKRSRQCGNEAHSGHGFWLAGNRLAFPFRPETFRPNRKIRLPDCTRAVNKRGAEKERKELLHAISWPGRKVVRPCLTVRKKFRSRGETFHSGTFFTIGQVGSQDYSWRTIVERCTIAKMYDCFGIFNTRIIILLSVEKIE